MRRATITAAYWAGMTLSTLGPAMSVIGARLLARVMLSGERPWFRRPGTGG